MYLSAIKYLHVITLLHLQNNAAKRQEDKISYFNIFM
jgi:hypothetical protein